jgi:hypothetical protein
MSSIKRMSRRRRFSSDYDSDRYCGLDSEIDWEDRFYESHGYYRNECPDDSYDPYDSYDSFYYFDYLEARNRYDDSSYGDYNDDCDCEDCQKYNKENNHEKKPVTDSANDSSKVVETVDENEMIPAEYMRKSSIAGNRKKSIRMSQEQYKKYLAQKENKKKSKRFGYIRNKILKEKKNKSAFHFMKQVSD